MRAIYLPIITYGIAAINELEAKQNEVIRVKSFQVSPSKALAYIAFETLKKAHKAPNTYNKTLERFANK